MSIGRLWETGEEVMESPREPQKERRHFTATTPQEEEEQMESGGGESLEGCRNAIAAIYMRCSLIVSLKGKKRCNMLHFPSDRAAERLVRWLNPSKPALAEVKG